MLLIPHILIRLLELCKLENLLIHNRLDLVDLNGTVHVLKLLSAANQEAAYSADVHEGIQESWLVGWCAATNEANNGDYCIIVRTSRTVKNGSGRNVA